MLSIKNIFYDENNIWNYPCHRGSEEVVESKRRSKQGGDLIPNRNQGGISVIRLPYWEERQSIWFPEALNREWDWGGTYKIKERRS